jgi:hypothetical protein
MIRDLEVIYHQWRGMYLLTSIDYQEIYREEYRYCGIDGPVLSEITYYTTIADLRRRMQYNCTHELIDITWVHSSTFKIAVNRYFMDYNFDITNYSAKIQKMITDDILTMEYL